MNIVINAEIASAPEGTTSIPNLGNHYHNLLSCLAADEGYPPVADLLRTYHELEGQWAIVSPIHWYATHNDALIVASGHELQLPEDESLLWFAAFREFVASENINVYYHNAHTWLLQSDGKPQIAAKPVHTLQNQSMMPELQALDVSLYWQRFITEIQMLFSAHPLNKSRTGLYPINGVWIWGHGKLPTPVKTPVVCNDDESYILATQLSTNVISYHPSTVLAKNSVLLFGHIGSDDHRTLQTRLQKKSVRWYWNNVAYLSKPKSWLSRFGLQKRIK